MGRISLGSAALVLLLLVVGVPAAMWASGAAYSGSAATYAATGNVTVDQGNWTMVPGSPHAESYLDNETVTVNGTTQTEGSDYRWSTTNGSVYWMSSGPASGQQATVSYAYRAHGQTGRSLFSVVTVSYQTLPGVLLVVAGLAVITLAYGAYRTFGPMFDSTSGRGGMGR